MDNTPLSSHPRSLKRFPKGLVEDSLAAREPSMEALRRAQAIIDNIKLGDTESAITELVCLRLSLAKKPPALMAILEALIDHLSPPDGEVAKYTGLIFYAYRIAESPAPTTPTEKTKEALHCRLLEMIVESSAGERENLLERLSQEILGGLLQTVQKEIAEIISTSDTDWIITNWLEPYGYDYIFTSAEIPVSVPSKEGLLTAFSYHDRLPEDENEFRLLRGQLVKQLFLPHLLVSTWPNAILAAERLFADDSSFAMRQDLVDITVEARKLLDERQAER